MANTYNTGIWTQETKERLFGPGGESCEPTPCFAQWYEADRAKYAPDSPSQLDLWLLVPYALNNFEDVADWV